MVSKADASNNRNLGMSAYPVGRLRAVWWSALLLLILTLGWNPPAPAAETLRVLVLLSKSTRPYQDFSDAMVRTAAERGAAVQFTQADLASLDIQELLRRSGEADLVIAAGTEAADRVSELEIKGPVLCALIPRLSYRLIQGRARARPRGEHAAIFIDQPFARKLDLIRTALPQVRTVGVILGPDLVAQKTALTGVAAGRNLQLEVQSIQRSEELLGALNTVLERSEVLLAVADPVVINSDTLQNLFLTSYLKRVPVVAYSRAYVNAGALMAVYSTPEQIGRQAVELVQDFATKRSFTGAREHAPKYFSVAVNRQVARSLGLYLKPEAEISRSLNGDQDK